MLTALPLLGAEGRPNALRQPNKVQINEYDNVLPQVAEGGGWSTRFMFVNMDATAGQFTLHFIKEDGTPWPIELKDIGQVTCTTQTCSVTRAVPIGGSVFLETAGTAATTSQGWAYLDSAPYWFTGMAIFKSNWIDPQSQRPVFAEGVVPLTSEVDANFFLPFDNRNGYVTSVALVNPYVSGTASLQVRVRDTNGTVIKQDNGIQLTAGQHIAFRTIDIWPETVGKNGAIEFLVPGGEVAVSGLGLLFAPNGIFTSTPVVSIDFHYF
jgi:hypothetical protein